jgi:hypothetical protein
LIIEKLKESEKNFEKKNKRRKWKFC